MELLHPFIDAIMYSRFYTQHHDIRIKIIISSTDRKIQDFHP